MPIDVAAKGSKHQHLYVRIAENLEHLISSEVLRMGDKLPSVRLLSKEQGVSMSTVLQAFYQLEAKGLIRARPQSGYYVDFSPRLMPHAPTTSKPSGDNEKPVRAEDMIDEVYSHMANQHITRLSISVPDPALLPLAKLNKCMGEAIRKLPASGTNYDGIEGNPRLRKQIARWSLLWEGKLREEELITTAGCMNGLAYALMALTTPGDTVAVESPVYFGILQLAQSLGLQVLELPTHPLDGIELEALKGALKENKIKVCLFISNFSNPVGSLMPDEHKKELVKLLEHYNVPLIEDDLYGDVHFTKSRPKTCKTYDESGLVLWCGSVSKTLAPGYRVGWIAPGKYFEKIKRLKLNHSISSPTLTHEAVASFLENGRYEHHLRRLREVLYANSLQYIKAISSYFPEDTKVSRPRGGFILWVELNPKIDTYQLYQLAMKHHISIAPGRMFTLQNQYRNCMRLSYGMQWHEGIDKALQTLGNLAKALL
jgi:DNA-binding transcriptional MocR family regulator